MLMTSIYLFLILQFVAYSFHHYIYHVWRRAIKKKEIKEEDDHVIRYKCKFAIDNYVYE
jgi:hypothetical protein